uniref:Peptidase S1 domain-containing protein n=1 Tax=Anopheles melas TaxID=34690 RepID=A0A182UKH1_9DIPT
ITLYGGSASLSKGGIVFYASKIVIHPLFNVETANYDAAIIQVKNSFQGYKNIARIPLQNAEVPSNTLCCVAGWEIFVLSEAETGIYVLAIAEVHWSVTES